MPSRPAIARTIPTRAPTSPSGWAWTRTGASSSCTPDVHAFELVDAAGTTVFTGRCMKGEDQQEQIRIHEKLDYTKASVRRLDFSAFNIPGN